MRTAYQLVNVLPTLLEAAGVVAADFTPRGDSMLPPAGGEDAEEATLFWEHIGNAAVRRGQWKLAREFARPLELYDIHTDRTELHNRAARFPEVLEELADEWQRWADRVGVVPWDLMVEKAVNAGQAPAMAEERSPTRGPDPASLALAGSYDHSPYDHSRNPHSQRQTARPGRLMGHCRP